MVRLGDVFPLIRNGASIKQTNGAGGYPITRIETIANREIDRSKFGYADIKDVEKYQDYLLQDGDILMSHINSEKHLGKVALYHATNEEKIIHGMNLLMLRADRNLILSDYAAYFFNSEAFLRQIPNITKKSVNQASFTVTALKELAMPVPELSKQRDISEKLDNVSILIYLRKEQLTKLDELVKSRFVELFDDNVPTAKLGDVCRMINGDRGKNYPSGDDFVENGVPFVNAGHLQNRKVDFCDMNYITEEKFNLLSQGKMQEGDILYCLRGSLGKHGLVDFERGAVASSLVILRCNQEQVLPQFLLYALETPEIELQSKAANNGSSQPNLSAASVKAYDIKLPTIEQQKQFVSFVEQTDKSKLAIQESLTELETLKKALMQKYFG